MIEWIKLGIVVANMLGTILVAVKVWLDSRQKATVSMIVDIDQKIVKRLDKLEKEIDEVQSEVKAWPGHEVVKRLHNRIDDIIEGNGDIKHEIGGLQTGLGQLAAQISMINEHLLRGK